MTGYSMSGDFIIFQQDSAPAHGACDLDTSNFCAVSSWNLNSGLWTHQTSTWSTIGPEAGICLQDVNNLKQGIISAWAEFKPSVIDTALISGRQGW